MGGSSGGGGGGAGAVTHASYMSDYFSDMAIGLGAGGGEVMTINLVEAMNTAQAGASPFATTLAYDPDADITAWEASITGFDAMLAGISEVVDWTALHAGAVAAIDGVEDAEIVADVTAFGNELDDQLTNITLPRFRAGMLNINAVVSSAYPIGTAVIEGFRTRDVARHSSKLRLASINSRSQLYIQGTEQLLRFLVQKYSWEDSLVSKIVESRRIKIVAKAEEASTNVEIDTADATWDLEVFQHGANMLASLGGGTAMPSTGKKPSQAASALGGAMAGAATGAMIGSVVPGIGTAVGAVVGGVLGAAQAFL